jgi:hypothetical protein
VEEIHSEKIREILSRRGYYISKLGLIQEDKKDEFSLGDIRYTHGIKKLFYGKEEVIVSNEIVENRTKLIRILIADKIPFTKARIKKTKQKFIVPTQLSASQD